MHMASASDVGATLNRTRVPSRERLSVDDAGFGPGVMPLPGRGAYAAFVGKRVRVIKLGKRAEFNGEVAFTAFMQLGHVVVDMDTWTRGMWAWT